MIANFANFNQCRENLSVSATDFANDVRGKEASVHVSLLIGQLAEEHLFGFWRQLQRLVDVFFGSTQQIRTNSVSQLDRTLVGNFNLQVSCIDIATSTNRFRNLTHKVYQLTEFVWIDKVKQTPQFF